jgi:hypothetical protein
MICSRVASRFSAVALVLSVACFSAAQKTFSFPHVLEKNGFIEGIAWNFTGGQPLANGGCEPFDALFSLYGSDSVYSWLIQNINGTPTKTSYSIYSVQKGARLGGLMEEMVPLEIILPACDGGSKDPAGLRAIGRITFKAKEGATIARAQDDLAKKQKTWLCSNFRIKIGNLPASRVSKVDAISIKQAIGDLDGDGAPDTYYRSGDVVVTLPAADAGMYLEAFRMSQAGSPVELPIQLDFLDGDGLVLLSYLNVMGVVGCGPSDMFADPADPDATVQVRLRSIHDGKKGILSIIR